MAANPEVIIEQPKVLSVALTMTPELNRELVRETGALEVAQAYVVDGAEMAIEANTELKAVKARITRIKELKAGFVAPAKTIIKNAEALFDPAIEALEGAERWLKDQLTRFDAEQKRLADEARRKREDEERRTRQEAEAKAAAERARAEEIAREERRRAEEAEAARKKAEAEGNAKAAAKAAAAAAEARAKEAATLENAERRAQQLELEASAAPTTPAPAVTKLSGFSTRDNWQGELDDVDEDTAKRLVCDQIAAGRTELLQLVSLEWPAIHKLAKALRKGMNVQGLRAVNKPVAASRGA